MKRTMFTALLAIAFGFGLMLLTAGPSIAIHKGAGNLACGGCHTMHNSQGSASLGGNVGGSLVLLRGAVTTRADIQNFCLQCHASNGTQALTAFNGAATAPKVYIDLAAGKGNAVANTDPFDFSAIGAGGDFSAVGAYAGGVFTLAAGDAVGNPALGYGHSIGINATPPGGNSGGAAVIINQFTCTSCHDPHGRSGSSGNNINLYRNLKYSIALESAGDAQASALAGMSSYVGGIQGVNFAGDNSAAANHIWPVMNAAKTSQNVYNAGAAVGAAGTDFSRWCAQCHGNWHEALVAGGNASGNDWLRHPVTNLLTDATPTSGAGVTIVDLTTYTAAAAGTKLPAIVGAGGTTYYATNAGTDRVFCLSCHYAHGGPNYDALRWNYVSSVSVGNQVGIGVPSNVGCQQCHNR